jgi:hypothetical protein
MKLLRTVGALGGSCALYLTLLRDPVLTWGATAEEAQALLPGDELLPDADGVSTRAISIEAPAAAVWPWIVQMGPAPRAGAYTYDWVENLLGLDMHSSNAILPQFQHPQVGLTIGFGSNQMRLERLEPDRVLSWRSADGNWVWSFVLAEQSGVTRLISRNRFRLPSPLMRLGMLPMEPASLMMERRMLLGIKRRAERGAGARSGFSVQEAADAGSAIGIDWASAPFDVEQFRMGMDVELEHGLHDLATNVTDDDPIFTAKIALAHLHEMPDYYTRLERMEREGERHAAA